MSASRFLSRIALLILGIRVTLHGNRASRSDAPCMASNHISFLDVIGFLSTGCSFVAKESVRELRLVGRVASAIGCIFVARDSSESRASARLEIKHKLESGQQKDQLVIFPEGTITNGDGLLEFRRGGFEACLPVQPVRLEYSNLQVSLALLSPFELLCFLCCLQSSEMHMHYLPVIQSDSAEALAAKCRYSIANAEGLRTLKLFGLESHRDEQECSRFVKQQLGPN